MKRFIFYFIILVIAVWLGIIIHRDPGYILITYQSWSLETTLWFGILAILVFFLLLYFLLRFFHGTSRLSEKWQHWLERRSEKKSNQLTFQGLLELAEGKWKQAEKSLAKGVKHSRNPLINYLGAAKAAQHEQLFEERDNYLRLAHQNCTQAEIVVALTQAQLQVDARQWELALATLRHLHQLAPSNIVALALLKTVYYELNDWAGLQKLLPELIRYKTDSTPALLALDQQTNYSLLNLAINSHNSQEINRIWQEMSKQCQQDPKILRLYLKYLITSGEIHKAEAILRENLKRNWNVQLAAMYGDIKTDQPEKQLAQAENWLKNHSNDLGLLLSIAKLNIYVGEYEKAKQYLLQSLQIERLQETLTELGQIFEKQQKFQMASQYYRQALDSPKLNDEKII